MPISNHVNLVDLDHPLRSTVAAFGAGGKSTLARAIAHKHGLAQIELDEIQWTPGWRMRPDEEIKDIVTVEMNAGHDGWVTDHQTRCVLPMILERAESVIVLELPFRVLLWRRLKRTVRRAMTREIVCGGNRETFRQLFLSRDSAVLEMWQRRKRYARIGETISAGAAPGVDLFYVRSAGELDRFYELQGLRRA
ncbi:MAG: hypothetical protein O3C10_09175 [Chloroflexi bacterium]|nr:hypothetical protein [Chloroflexota bacterium]